MRPPLLIKSAALAFSTNAGGQGMDVWAYDVKGKQLRQATHGADMRRAPTG